MFVSNSDNLGATMDLKILTHFVQLVSELELSNSEENHLRARDYLKQLRQSGAPFMMEVAERTDAAPTLEP